MTKRWGGGRGGGLPMRGLGNDKVISGPMRGFEKRAWVIDITHTDTKTHGHSNSNTYLAH